MSKFKKGGEEPQDALRELLPGKNGKANAMDATQFVKARAEDKASAKKPEVTIRVETGQPEDQQKVSFAEIPLNRIKPSPTNPRTTFDEKKTLELAESIKEKGVISPVLVRPYGKEGWYQLVYGQRREKASLLAGKTTIPALIRELTDDEVIELQITENLQREDIKAIEEAASYKNLMAMKGYTVQELSHRLGKPAAFISQRLKLNSLIEEFQKAMFEDRITIVDALKVAKLLPADQRELYTEHEFHEGEIRIHDNMVNAYTYDLNNAPFDITDVKLRPDRKDCPSCIYNTACSSQLFVDPNEKARCTDTACFKDKTHLWYKRELDKATSDPLIYLVTNDESKTVEALRSQGLTIYAGDTWDEIENPGEFDPDDLYLDEDDEDYKEDLARGQKQHDSDVKEYKQAIEKAPRAFVVDGHDRGTYIHISFKTAKSKAGKAAVMQSDAVDPTIKISQIKEEIKRIQDKEVRQIDLDYFKVLPEAYKALEDTHVHYNNSADLTAIELAASIMDLSGYWHLQDIRKFMKVPDSCYGDIQLYNLLKTKAPEQLKKCLIMVQRSRLHKFLKPEGEQSPAKHINMLALVDQYKARLPKEYSSMIEGLEIKKKKRAGSIKTAIAELQDQLREIEGSKVDRVVKASAKKKIGGGG